MKLPKGYVPGVGVHKATAYGGFGQRLLERMGWEKGQGLGKDKSGMSEALEVKEKKDTLGVGANNAWNWEHKFWEESFNSAVKSIAHDTSSDSDSDSSSSSSGSSSSSSSDDDSDDDTTTAVKAVNRDGTFASASEAELKIAASLSKDPWGRWGGRAGKMARIRQQEEEQAAALRAKLGLDPLPAKPQPASNGAAEEQGGKRKRSAEAEQQQPQQQEEAPAAKKRIVVTLKVKDDPSIKRLAFKPTPATGWWGATYFMSAGAMGGMDDEDNANRERKTFNEDDQAALYMQVHDNQRQGRRGLGKSTTIKIAGGKWEGTRKTFEEEEEEEAKGGQQQGRGAAEPASDGEAAADGSSKKKKKDKKDKKAKKESKESSQEAEVEAAAAAAEADDEGQPSSGKDRKKKKKKKQHSQVEAEAEAAEQGQQQQQQEQEEQQQAQAAGDKIKWSKVIKKMLKQAPERRLKLKHLCKQLMSHAKDNHSSHQGVSKQDIHEIVMKQVSKSSNPMEMEGKYVMLKAA